jgi:hypothetical protein
MNGAQALERARKADSVLAKILDEVKRVFKKGVVRNLKVKT